MADFNQMIDFVARGRAAQAAADRATGRAAHRPCPFCGGTEQQLLLSDDQAEQQDGTYL